MFTVLQIGEGNFLRAFAEDYIQNTEGYKVVICQPRTNTRVITALNNQDCKYDVIMRGRLGGEIVDKREKITCVSQCIDTVGEYDKLKKLFCSDELKFVISNTTEAGICFDSDDKMNHSPRVSFPAKVTALLYERYLAGKSELTFLPVELIDNNGDELKKCVSEYAKLWNLNKDFISYINRCNFCNTLVDRIVTGHIDTDSDPCSVACEPYKSWIIEGDENLVPFKGVTFTDDISQYRTRKVRILNGAHTMSVLAGYMAGFDIVRDMVCDKLFSDYIKTGLGEIKSTISVPCDDFANSVLERFNNPFIDHKLLDIALNSVSKFRVRCLDTMLDYYKAKGEFPKVLTFSLSALIAFYMKLGHREYNVNDSQWIVDFFETKPSVREILSNTKLWGVDLSRFCDLSEITEKYIDKIKSDGISKAIEEVVYG